MHGSDGTAQLGAVTRRARSRPLLTAHGFSAALIASLVNQRLATLTHGKVRAGGKLVEVAKVRITDAGRDVLAAEG